MEIWIIVSPKKRKNGNMDKKCEFKELLNDMIYYQDILTETIESYIEDDVYISDLKHNEEYKQAIQKINYIKQKASY